jgi:hypothetical protein
MIRDAKQKPFSGAERMRQSRQRRREGFIGVICVEVRQREVAALVARGLLAAADRGDRGAIAEALGRLLDSLL